MDYFLKSNGAVDVDSNDFTTFVLSNKHYTSQDFSLLNASLAKNPGQTALLLSSKANRALFVSDFSERNQRILTWLQNITELNSSSKNPSLTSINKDIIHKFAASIVLPLLEPDETELYSLRGFTDLLISTIHLSYVYRNRGVGAKIHKTLLEKISRSSYLIQRILPSIDGAKLLQTILAEAQAGAEIRSFGGVTTLTEWTRVAVDLCRKCRANHCVNEQLSRWTSLNELQNSLQKILEADDKRRRELPQLPMLRGDFSGMRILSMDDKKSGNKSEYSSLLPELPLSPEDYRNMDLFNIRRPTGIGAVEGIITRLQETETFYLFQALVKSFPCAPCLLDKAAPTVAVPRKHHVATDLPNSFTSTLFGQKLGPWRICLSEAAFKDVQSTNKEGHLNAIANKLRALASGHWDVSSLRKPLSQKMLEEAKEEQRVPLWRAEYASNGRILWQVNVGFDEDVGASCQIITVWRIGQKDEVRKAIRNVLRLQKPYTDDDIRDRTVSFRSFPVLPKTCADVEYHSDAGTIIDETVLAAQEALMSNKFYCLTSKVLDRIFTGSNSLEFPFDISKEETKIIKHSNSAAFIQGRSGTGKTTCLLFKLLCRNISSRENEGSPVRQIFVTRSSFLAERLSQYLRRLMVSQLGNFSIPEKPEVASSSLEFATTLKEAEDPLEELSLDNIDDDKFPIVCTFEQLFHFLERVIKFNERNDFSALFEHKNSIAGGRVSKVVDYEIFSTQYWKKHSYDTKKGFEPEIAFAEFIGTIKGSTSAQRGFRPLSRDEYVNGRSPVFTDHASRDIIYDMYQAYERKKRILGDRDDIDRVTKLLKSLEEDQDLKTRVQSLFDEVYVDELQDNKLLELDLILMLVRNPNGIHFAGDTAQCISRDNTFRFQDIKARFYEHFIAMAEEARKRSWARPELFQLAKNYRSHQGILSLAAEIVDMLCNGFPGQIDPLPREVGSYPGTKPTVFVGFDHEILAEGGAAILGTEEGLSCFGAEQVIIVRDDAAKEELQELLGTTLILTIFQSKGLEFDDVVLYNFFTNSMWRNVSVRVLKLLLTKNSASGLDTQKYGMLCSELKHLYVAVTRARKNLWLVESDPASVHSILTLWMRREEDAAGDPLVSIVDVNDPEAQNKVQKIIKPARSTNPKAWEKQGEEFLHRNLYKEALICFRRARNTTGQSVATAYLKYQEARAKDVDVKEVQREARVLYEEAANLFLKANFIQKAAEAWAATRQYRKAADVLRNHGMHGRAGLLYEEARDFRQAAICYDTAKQYDNAVTAYRKGEYFTELIDYLTKNVDRISKSLRTRYSTLINILLQRGDLVLPEASLSAAVETLGDDQEKEDFYKKFNRTGDLWNFYMQKTRYHKAFKLALREGKFEDAVGLSQGQGLRPATAGVDSVIPEYEMLTLFNGLMAEHAWLSMGIRFNGISRSKATSSGAANPISNILRKSTPPVLRGARLGWEQITDCIDDAGTGLTLTRPLENRSSANFFQEFGNDFLDLVELVRLDKNHGHLAQVKDFAEVPIAALSKIATISGDMLGNKPPPTSLLTCVGALLLAPDLDADPSKEVIVFSWSPLLPSTVQGNSSATLQRQHVFMNTQQVFVSFKSWLMRLVTRIIPIALKQLHAVVNGRKDPCFRFLQSGLCRNQIHEETFRHTRSSSEEARGYTLALLEVAGLACATNRLYYNRTLGESESKAFQGTKRAFLERLLKELTFISPFLNDVTVQHQTWDMILAEDGQWLHVRDGMASLFFFRLQTFEWEKRTTLSAVLEESGLAIKLGAMWRFEKFLKRNRATRDLGTTVALLKDFERLQPNNVSKFSCDELSHCAFRWTTFITDLDFYELQAFHAVLSFFELISLELLNRATRLDFLVPRSRLHFVRRDLSGTPALNEKERCDIENVLIEVLQRLCEILSYFAQEYHQRLAQLKLARQTDDEIDPTAHPEALFEVCGYPLRRGNTYMIRRALDHLALCMVNLGVGRIAPIGYQNVLWKAIVQAYTQWKDILRHPTMVDWSSPPLPENIAVQLVNAYKRYNKDELVILEGSSYRAIVKPTSRYQFLIAQGIKVLPKEQPIVRKSKAPAAVSKRKKELDNSEEAIQATKIARWWKRCSVILRSRRENAAQRAQKIASGPQGEAEVAIHDLIAPAMRPRFWHQGRILENSGVAFFRGVLELGTLINTTHAVAMEALTSSRGKYKLSSQFVEHTQQTIGLLEKRKTYLEKQKTFFRNEKEGQALLEMPLDKLQEKMDTALETLEKYTKEVHRWKTEIEGGLKQGKASSVTKPYI